MQNQEPEATEEMTMNRIRRIREFGARYSPDIPHDEQVRTNALQLFDALQSLHHLSDDDRFILEAATLLHDIGWSRGISAHHKSGSRMIREDTTLPLTELERDLVAQLIRYHRKALPAPAHGRFAALDEHDKARLRMLAAILRVADGLDRTHQSLVETITATITPDMVTIRCLARGEGYAEREYAKKKSDLFEDIFSRKLHTEWERFS